MPVQRKASACLVGWCVSILLLVPDTAVLALPPMSTNLVRISTTPAGFGPDEKETALLILREWGLGSFRLFAEVAGELCDALIRATCDSQGFSLVIVVVIC